MFEYFRDTFYMFLSWFCRNTLWLSRIIGFFYRKLKWMISGWRLVLILSISIFLIIKETFLFPSKYNFPNEWNLYVFLTILFLAVLFFVTTKQKERIVIEPFVDFTGEDPKKGAKGLSTLLMAELSKLQKTFYVSEEAQQRSVTEAVGQCRTINAEIIPGKTEAILKDLESSESKISFGFLKIPIGFIAGIVARISKSPRILTTLHKENGTTTLNARITGWTRSYNWQVANTEDNVSMKEMLEELSYRIFNDLYMESTKSWEAVRAVGEGLEHYRDSLSTKEDKSFKLEKAEKKFMEALSKDLDFDLSFYNLGLVYLEQKEWKAAESAFMNAINNNPKRWESYYALALAFSGYLESRQKNLKKEEKCKIYNDIIQNCERVITLKPDSAKAYNQKSIILYHKEKECTEEENYEEAIKCQKCAVEFAFRDLWSAVYTNSESSKQTAIVVHCLQNLAKGFEEQTNYKKAEKLLRYALSLDDSNRDLYYQLGKICHVKGKNRKAIKMYESAIEIMPRQEYWAFLSLAYEKNGEKNLADYAFKQAKESITSLKSFTQEIDEFKDLYQKVAGEDTDDLKKLDALKALIAFRKKYNLRYSNKEPDEKKELCREACSSSKEGWERGWSFYQFGRYYSDIEKYEEAILYFKKAKEIFNQDHKKEMKYCELNSWISESYVKQKKYHEALKHALYDISSDPLYAPKRKKLGKIYLHIEDYDLAHIEFKKALLWRPDDAESHWLRGLALYKKAWGYHKSEERDEIFKMSIDAFKHALDLLKRDKIDEKGKIDYAIGLVYDSMGKHKEAIPYFEIADIIFDYPEKLLTRLHLGWQYFKNREFEQAERVFQTSIDSIEGEMEVRVDRVLECQAYKDMPMNIYKRVEGEVISLIYYALAFCQMSREVDIKKSDELLEKAKKSYIEGLRNSHRKEQTQNDKLVKSRADYAESYWEDGKGWLEFKQNNIKESIRHFQKSIDLRPHPRVYLHIALAYEREVDTCMDTKEKAQCTELSKRYCMNAKKLDINEEHRTEIEMLLTRLDKNKKEDI